MLNQIVVVGRLLETPKVVGKGSKKVCNITLEVPRNYKNDRGEYENDYIECILWSAIVEQIEKVELKERDLIGVKGRLQKGTDDDKMIVIAEKITYLSDRKED